MDLFFPEQRSNSKVTIGVGCTIFLASHKAPSLIPSVSSINLTSFTIIVCSVQWWESFSWLSDVRKMGFISTFHFNFSFQLLALDNYDLAIRFFPEAQAWVIMDLLSHTNETNACSTILHHLKKNTASCGKRYCWILTKIARNGKGIAWGHGKSCLARGSNDPDITTDVKAIDE